MSILWMAAGCADSSDSASEKNTQKEHQNINLNNIADALLQSNPEPAPGESGGDWIMFGLARWGEAESKNRFEGYYEKLAEYVKQNEGILHSKKYTEYSRTILVLTAMGKDPSNVAGYNLLEPLADFEQTVFQGVNGAAFALLALDSGSYEIPENKYGTIQATRQMYVEHLLEKESVGGGWSLAGGVAEADMTAMVLQALAKYKEDEAVEAAIDRGLAVLSRMQSEAGGYISYDVESSESISQVIVALCELGIDLNDARFVKNGRTLEDRLMDFQIEGGAFRHTLDGDINVMATEQAFYALVAIDRTKDDRTTLYDMTDVKS
ncbi:MAG: hypothetical protein E7253_08530 [Lachnospiraceae bacterium]|nr:hypothetical protein [Lachnospiraceae bacterium]